MLQYGATIFESAGIDDPILIQLILGAVNVVTTFPGLYIVEKLGRRIPLIAGAVWQGVWLCIFASVGTALPPTENPVAGTVMIVSACMFIASFAMTWGYVCNFNTCVCNMADEVQTIRMGCRRRDVSTENESKAGIPCNSRQLAW